MSTLAVELHPLAHNVLFTDDSMAVELLDGRAISVPLIWFPILANASETELNTWELLGDGGGIHWSLLDEDLSIVGLLIGNSSSRG